MKALLRKLFNLPDLRSFCYKMVVKPLPDSGEWVDYGNGKKVFHHFRGILGYYKSGEGLDRGIAHAIQLGYKLGQEITISVIPYEESIGHKLF
jgi:hypothetical protein